MANRNSPRFVQAFVQQQTTAYGTVNNSSGTWANTGAKWVRIPESGMEFTPNMPKTPQDWVTGYRSAQPGIVGRVGAGWRINNMPIFVPGNGNTTVPDSDPFWAHAFGVSTFTSGTGTAYTLSDAVPNALTLFKFVTADAAPTEGISATLTQELVWGACVQEITWTFNGSTFVASLSGQGGYVLDSDFFSSEMSGGAALAGLTAYPAIPSAPTSTGVIIPGFQGTALIDGNALACNLQAMTIKYQTGISVYNGVFCSAYGEFLTVGERHVGCTMSFVDDDSSALQTLKKAAKANTLLNAVVTVGVGPYGGFGSGYEVQFTVKNLQVVPQTQQDSGDIVLASFPESAAHASSATAIDEFSMTYM